MEKLRGRDLINIGYPETKVIGLAINIALKHYKHVSKEEVLNGLADVIADPTKYLGHEFLAPIADEFVPKIDNTKKELNSSGCSITIYGEDLIEPDTVEQMKVATRLPISKYAALMPDGHTGYGLSIGGVLATKNAIIPYGVGVDIGCRMALSLCEVPSNFIDRHVHNMKQYLMDHTKFGMEEVHDRPSDHEIMDRKEFNDIKIVKSLKDKAWKQLGTSGSGNHFVNFGEVEILHEDNELNIPVGKYLGILTHSGSRGLGANIADFYTKLAMKSCVLPDVAKNLAWLDMDSEAGQEYWLAMNLAGDYASACHHDIHKRLLKEMGLKSIALVENHHNFAWKEIYDGEELIVHRKGATPAAKGVLGIIPGSMATKGFIVKGKGNVEALNSASHGAGRVSSRKQAKNNISKTMLEKVLADNNVLLIGGDVDEAPMAYKDIEQVIKKQTSLVEIVGSFMPRVVRMDINRPKKWE